LPLGFTISAPSRAETNFPPDGIFHLFPYLPTSAPFTALFELLLLEQHPIVISVRFRPTRLRGDPRREAARVYPLRG
jgi:hypothetical protein